MVGKTIGIVYFPFDRQCLFDIWSIFLKKCCKVCFLASNRFFFQDLVSKRYLFDSKVSIAWRWDERKTRFSPHSYDMFGSKEDVFNSKSLALWTREPDLYPTASNEQTRRVCSLLVRLACYHHLLTNTLLRGVAPESGEHGSMRTIDQFIKPNKFLTWMSQPVYWYLFVHFLVSIRYQRN